ncbi:hypothetical protein V8D89_003326 [Ganoderma adspersum]
MAKFDETTLRELTWDNLKAVAKENGVRVAQKREKITEELLMIEKPKMTVLAKLRGDKSAIKMEKIRRRTVGHVKTPPRPPSSRAAAARRLCASASRRARKPESEAEPQPQPEGEVVEAVSPVAFPPEEKAEAKPEEELRPLERAGALRLERQQAEREKSAKEEVAAAEAQPPSAAALEDTDEDPLDIKQTWPSPVRELVLVPMGVHVPFNLSDFQLKHTPRISKENWPDEWRVGLLSPDPKNPRPVFSPPTKPCDEPAKGEPSKPLAPVSDVKDVACAPEVEEQEQAYDGDTDTDLEEDEVFEMTSIDDIRVTLPRDETPYYIDEGDKTVCKKRKAEEGGDEAEGNEDSTITVYEQSPKKRRRTGLRGWLSKVF